MVGASGRFELEVVEVQNPRSEVRSGKCCGGAERPSDDAPCPSQCRTVVALCLKEYQSVAVEGSKAAPRAQPDTSSGRGGCTYGEDTSVVLGLSSFTLTQSPPNAHIQLPFTFSWTVSGLVRRPDAGPTGESVFGEAINAGPMQVGRGGAGLVDASGLYFLKLQRS
ncbi:protein jagged-1-like isoform X2 [Scylla paramamosain]